MTYHAKVIAGGKVVIPADISAASSASRMAIRWSSIATPGRRRVANA